MPRTVTLGDGTLVEGVPDHVTDEEVRNDPMYAEYRQEDVEELTASQEAFRATNPSVERMRDATLREASHPSIRGGKDRIADEPTGEPLLREDLESSETTWRQVGADLQRVAARTVHAPSEAVYDMANWLAEKEVEGIEDPADYEVKKREHLRFFTELLLNQLKIPVSLGDNVFDKENKIRPLETGWGMAAEMGTYVGGAMGGAKALTRVAPKIPQVLSSIIGGEAAVQLLADPDENLFNLIETTFPEASQYMLVEYMAADEEDPETVKRLKLLGEGFGLSVLIEGLQQTVKVGGKGLMKLKRNAQERYSKNVDMLNSDESGELFYDYMREAKLAFQRNKSMEAPGVVFTETAQGANQVLLHQNTHLQRFVKQFFTTHGYFSPRAHHAFESAEHAQRQWISAAEHSANRLERSLRRLGDMENGPDMGQLRGKIDDLLERDLSFLEEWEIPASEKAGVLAQKFGLPIDVAGEVLHMRGMIDDLSIKILGTDVGSDKLKEVIVSNIGKYRRHSYRRHEDVGYEPTPEHRADAIRFFQRIELDRLSKDKNVAQSDVMELSLQNAIDSVNDILGSKDMEGVHEHYMKARRVNTEILKKRDEELPQEIRNLLGEIKEPGENLVITVSKMSRLFYTHRFYNQLKELGRDGGYIVGPDRVRDAKKLTAEITGTNSVLDGSWTTPEMLKAIKGTESQLINWDAANHAILRQGYRNFLSMKGQVQSAKTAYSHTTHIRNFLGGVQFALANGANPFASSESIKPFRLLKNQLLKQGDKELDTTLERLQGMGVINTNVKAGEFRALMETGAETSMDGALNRLSKFAEGRTIEVAGKQRRIGLSKTLQKAPMELYMATDDFFKIANYASELDTLKRAYPVKPGWNKQQIADHMGALEERAAHKVKNTFPNYDRVPKGVKAGRELPVGNFTSFPSEIIRTSMYIVKTASEEIISDNPVMRARGLKRLSGFMASTVGWGALSYGTASLVGFSEDEAAAAAVLTETPWSKTSSRNWAIVDGKIYYNDTQFTDSYSFIKEPVMAAFDEIVSGELQGEELEKMLFDASMAAGSKLLAPYIEESILTGALRDVGEAAWRPDGRTSTGKPIFTPGLSGWEKSGAAFRVLAEGFVPGTILSIEDLFEVDNPNRITGTKPSAGAEYVSQLTGNRWREFVPLDHLKFKLIEYNVREKDILWVQPDYELEAQDLVTRYVNRQSERYELQQELYRHIKAAQVLAGIDPEKKLDIMTDADVLMMIQENGFTTNEASFLAQGYFVPEKPTAMDPLEVYQKTPLSGLPSRPLMMKKVSSEVWNAWAEMGVTPLDSDVGLPGELEELFSKIPGRVPMTLREQRKRSGLEKGGKVSDVAQVVDEPDERIDPITGLPYNQTAGAAFMDEEDPLRRLGFGGGGTAGFKWFMKVFGEEAAENAVPVITKKGDLIPGVHKLPVEAKESAGLTDVDILNWKDQRQNFKRQEQPPELKEAAARLEAGELDEDGWLAMVQEKNPISSIIEMPHMPTTREVISAILDQQQKAGIVYENLHIKNGTLIASRLDIPAYEKFDTWVVSLHDGRIKEKGLSLGYGQTAVLNNVKFGTNPKLALRIAKGETGKKTMARMYGEWENMDPEDVRLLMLNNLTDDEWAQVGVNPHRASYFYDKATGKPVVEADRVLQLGPLVLAKNIKTASRQDPQFLVNEEKLIHFAEGGEADSDAVGDLSEAVASRLGISHEDIAWAKELGTSYGELEEMDGRGDAARHLALGWLIQNSNYPRAGQLLADAREVISLDVHGMSMDSYNHRLGSKIVADNQLQAEDKIKQMIKSNEARFMTPEESRETRGY